jgi:hypothetical protein
MKVVQAPSGVSVPAPPVVHGHDSGLLPGPAAVPVHLRQVAAGSSSGAATLILIGLLYRGVGWSLAPSTMATVIAAVTRSMRAGDWIGRSGISDLAVVVEGDDVGAAVMAERLVRVVNDLRTPGVAACGAVATLAPGGEALAALSTAARRLGVACRLGPGAVVPSD